MYVCMQQRRAAGSLGSHSMQACSEGMLSLVDVLTGCHVALLRPSQPCNRLPMTSITVCLALLQQAQMMLGNITLQTSSHLLFVM